MRAFDGQTTSATDVQVRVNVAFVNDRPTLTAISKFNGGTSNLPYTISTRICSPVGPRGRGRHFGEPDAVLPGAVGDRRNPDTERRGGGSRKHADYTGRRSGLYAQCHGERCEERVRGDGVRCDVADGSWSAVERHADYRQGRCVDDAVDAAVPGLQPERELPLLHHVAD